MYLDYTNLDFSEIQKRGGIAVLGSELKAMQRKTQPEIYTKLMQNVDIYDVFGVSFEPRKYACVIVPMGADEIWIKRHENVLKRYLDDGGIVLNFAQNLGEWLPGNHGYVASKTPIRTREIYSCKHPIFRGVRDYDFNYRRGVKGFFNRGYIDAPKDAIWLLRDSDDKCVAYIDNKSTKGLILATAGADLMWYGFFEQSTAKRMGYNTLIWLENYLKTGEIA